MLLQTIGTPSPGASMVASSCKAWSSSPSHWLPVASWPWARATPGVAVGLSRWDIQRDRGARGEGAVGGGWQPLGQMGRTFTGTPRSKVPKALFHGRRHGWSPCSSKLCLQLLGWGSLGVCGCWQQKERSFPVGRCAFAEYKQCPGVKELCWRRRHQGRQSQSQQHLATGSIHSFCTPGGAKMAVTMQQGSNGRRQKGQQKERGRTEWCCESCTCIPPRRLPQSALRKRWKCKSFCLFPDMLKSTRLRRAAQNPCYVFMSELVALTKEAGREGRRCLLKEEGKASSRAWV